ncbi:hypothetical protein [Rhizosphaericola mali]|uniref:Uncharacterized protein n=1 Tax=Rhizosphaericola mali TaxID=2545455 RepID=A0A5P2G8T5_9BACT|nr:hypothetical protein [Rhizosphaericola mali]QES90342.1 hypothetical protein E0W69_017345 [Rhizosphaericola mali]
MPRKKSNLSEKEKFEQLEQKYKIKRTSLKRDFENGKVTEFAQIEALVPYSILSKNIHMGFDTLKKKVINPGDFSNNEISRMAEYIEIDFDVMLSFILSKTNIESKLLKK